MAQGEVWHSIRESSRRAGVVSETGALDEVYAGRRERLADRERHFPVEPDQIGLLALDAEVERTERAPRQPALSDADALLAAVHSARRHPMATAGLGTYATLAGDVVGGELAVAGDTVHLCAFPAD